MVQLPAKVASSHLRNEHIPLTSPSLLLRIRDSADASSWERFQQIYQPIIHAFCRRRGFQAADVDDICQEVMAAVARSIRSFEYRPEAGRFRSWLATVTANMLRNKVRRNNRIAEVSVDWIDTLAAHPEQDSDWNTIFIERVFAIACENVRNHFETETWRCFELAWVARKPSNTIAQELGIPIYRVYVNKSRVLRRLELEFRLLGDDLP